ncbi:MAG: FHA domain-containing protein [Butyrivibrio sp.]|uniref:FHA domain-containing protein n=1 Tax=Butyrivibrio sp. TaxID=28121 RepID=UPI0025E2E82C|nr:FHA domain-containing protein [Butyrivibrio sp.]MCR5771979.1 FHA domain-containing protein [Butyrivibrio sp.]
MIEMVQKYWYVLIAIIVLLIAFIIVLLVYIKNNSAESGNKKAEKTSVPKNSTGNNKDNGDNVHRTKFVDLGDRESGDTILLFDSPGKVWIDDMDRPEIKFEMPLTDAGINIGYDKSNQVCLDYDDTVSSVHCRIYPSGSKTYIENKSRTNPIIVNGQKIEESAAIYSGTELIVGNIRLSIKFA